MAGTLAVAREGRAATLADLVPGGAGEIRAVGGGRAFRRRLLEMGLVPGTRVELVAVAPLGDPLQVAVRGGLLSIRRCEAAELELALLDGGLVAA